MRTVRRIVQRTKTALRIPPVGVVLCGPAEILDTDMAIANSLCMSESRKHLRTKPWLCCLWLHDHLFYKPQRSKRDAVQSRQRFRRRARPEKSKSVRLKEDWFATGRVKARKGLPVKLEVTWWSGIPNCASIRLADLLPTVAKQQQAREHYVTRIRLRHRLPAHSG